jgi:hypothetical protein
LRLDSKEDDTRLARRATDAQVALDLIHTYGTDKDAFVIMASQRASELSGGMFTSLRTAESQLTRIDEATRARYVLGYASTNPKLDGKYRNVSVKVNRKNVTVIFPHGYTAQPDAPPLPLREIVTRQRLRDAVATDVSQDDIKIQATASVITDAATNTHRLKVDLKIDPANLSLKLADGKRQGVIDLLIVCGDMKQKAIGSLNQQMTLGLDDAHYQQALATGIPYTATVPVNGTPALVKVLVYDYDKDLLGATTVKLR